MKSKRHPSLCNPDDRCAFLRAVSIIGLALIGLFLLCMARGGEACNCQTFFINDVTWNAEPAPVAPLQSPKYAGTTQAIILPRTSKTVWSASATFEARQIKLPPALQKIRRQKP